MESGTRWLKNPQSKKSEFKTEAFRYLAGGNEVHVECLVRVCLATEESQECTLCSKRKRRDVGSVITSRSASTDAGEVAFVQSNGFYIIDRGKKSLFFNNKKRLHNQRLFFHII